MVFKYRVKDTLHILNNSYQLCCTLDVPGGQVNILVYAYVSYSERFPRNSYKCYRLHKGKDALTRATGHTLKKNKLRGFSPLANYTDRAIAAGQRS
jgi:hypothetical protein